MVVWVVERSCHVQFCTVWSSSAGVVVRAQCEIYQLLLPLLLLLLSTGGGSGQGFGALVAVRFCQM